MNYKVISNSFSFSELLTEAVVAKSNYPGTINHHMSTLISDQTIKEARPIIRTIANQHQCSGVPFKDLESAGIERLMLLKGAIIHVDAIVRLLNEAMDERKFFHHYDDELSLDVAEGMNRQAIYNGVWGVLENSSQLTAQEKQILGLRFGRENRSPLTFREIAKIIKKSSSQTSASYSKAIRKIKGGHLRELRAYLGL
jgi:hypothetical protein